MTALAGIEMNLIPMGLMHVAEGMSRLAASSVVSGLWEGVALAAGAALCLRMVPRTTAAMRFAVWTGVFAVLALLPLLHAYIWHAKAAGAVDAAAVRVDVRWSVALAVLWLAMSLVRGVKLAVGAVRLHGLWKTAVPVDLTSRHDLALSAAESRGAQLCTSVEVDRPSVIGFFSPRILIPEELYGRLTATELQQVVLHEVGHLRRADDWINLLQKLSLVLVPLNPALMWIEQRLCLERELACDDSVLLLTKAPKAYATCLANLAEHRLGRQAVSLSLGAWEKRSELARRVHCILRRSEGMSTMQARVVLGTLALFLLGGATELSRCPQLISFSGGGSAPMTAEVQSLGGAGYQPVAFHPASRARRSGAGSPHETLLNASMSVRAWMPVGHRLKPVSAVPVISRRSAAPSLLRSKQDRSKQGRSGAQRTEAQQKRHWVVLTSWSEQEIDRSRVFFSEPGERVFSSSYAAVPTEAGWLVFQL